MHKWFGTPVPVWVRPLQSLVAAEATTLTLETDDGVSVGSLGGSGTIVASSLQNVSSLALDNPLKCLTVSSEVTFADNGTVEFGSVDARLAPGDYVIFSAGKIVNPDAFASWTLTGDLPGRHILSLVVEGNDVILRVASYGMMILIR